MLDKIRLFFLTNENKWLSYNDLLEFSQLSKGGVRSLISQLRYEHKMVIVSEKRKGFKYIDLDKEQDKATLLEVEHQARKELAMSYAKLKLYNNWLDQVVDSVQDTYQDQFHDYLQEVKEASGYRGSVEDMIDTKEDRREQVKYFLGEE